MEIAHRWIDRNLSKLELIVSILILFLFIGYFSRYMFTVFGKVEKSMIDRTLININTAINYEAAFAVMRKDMDKVNQLTLMNPMDIMTSELNVDNFNQLEQTSLIGVNYLATIPANYAGAVIDDGDPSLESGKWYFDQDDRFLFYKLNNSEFFTSDIEGPARIRFRINLKYIDQNNDNSFNLLVDRFDSIQLQTIDNYQWSF